MRILLLISFLIWSPSLEAQDSDMRLELSASADTIYFGNAFKVEYKFVNGRFGRYATPELANFDLLAGPNRSSSMSIINGQRSSEEIISNYYRPQKTGTFEIPGFQLERDDKTMYSNAITIVVVENPDNLQQDPNTGQLEGRPMVKKKVRKRYKI
ncbi:MAG: BatD family protein [Bacteroidia bacterium]|nr:BatD family protein [Bacteroidia bacterium]